MILVAVAIAAVPIAAVVLLTGWAWMLALGVVHSFLPGVPALGYWHSVAVMLAVCVLTSPFRSSK